MKDAFVLFRAPGMRGLLQKLAVIGMTLFIVVPYIPIVIYSFSRGWFWPDLLPSRWSLQNWAYTFSHTSGVIPATFTTFGIALAVVILATAISLPAARVMGRSRFRGKALVEIMLLAPLVVPEVAVSFGVLLVFIKLGLANNVLGVILVHLIPSIPYMVTILSSVFEGLDPNAEEQARSLGASPFQAFVSVTLPMIMPGVVAGALQVFLISVNNFVYTYMVGGGVVITLPLVLFSFLSHAGINLGIASSISIMLSLPCLIFLLITERLVKEEYFAMGFGHS